MSSERSRAGPIDARNGIVSSPAEHAASPTSPALSAASFGRTSFQSHGKSLSMASTSSHPARSNRFSVQFPIASGSNTPARTTSPVREVAAEVPVAEALALLQNGAPDSNSFLSLIASQERRVLELKEELLRAEADLDKLKRQWARHEVQKKREDVKRLTKLQPLQTALPVNDTEEDVDGSSAWMQQEMERRKALLSRSNTTGGRTILPGQRHTRALSLLSPARDNNIREFTAPAPQRPPPPRKDSLKNRPSVEGAAPDPPPLIEPITETADLTNEIDRTVDANIDLTQRATIDQEALLKTGKKMATDFKDGLWTFWEDLRQATVGEESVAIPPPRRKSSTQTLRTARKQGSRNSLRPSSRGSSTMSKSSDQTVKQPSPNRNRKQSTPAALPDLADPSFWTEHGVTVPSQTSQPATKKATTSKHAKSPSVAKRLSVVSNDAWDTWDDSPEQSRSGSSVTSDAGTLPSTVSGSPRTSISITGSESAAGEKRDPIPWPVLKKSGLGSLRRTASNLMQEWENSLKPTPSPNDKRNSQADYLGVSAEAEAYGAGRM
ncbi:hypothetical protein HII31_04472 [Pseudocercospora fuligena]|uniref:DUF4048 domain-containing protein n=1 Tax=Pseudocercospora fuligena TaxID=685502 RepID=A0A8H6RLV5_9PEZI|nr:hypothetical protein HII31_04472 [Pseudocercospora fuligena]